ncbi:MAG: CDP-alcohol phosphatidyltransferase family protein [Candidatus Omnitrophota bacterium]
MNLANRISITRIMLVPFFVASVVYSRFTLALSIFVICIMSDALDGYIARTKSQKTSLGALLDPIADKLLLVSGFVSLSMISDLPENLRFPPYVPLIVISRDLFMVLGCVVIYLLKGKLDIRPTYLGKATTFLQMMSIVSILVHFHYSNVIWNIAVVFTVISGLDYLRSGNRMLNGSH